MSMSVPPCSDLNGFNVTVIEARNMMLIKRKYGVPKNLEGCHTIVVGDYVVEGRVPATSIRRLRKTFDQGHLTAGNARRLAWHERDKGVFLQHPCNYW